MSLPCTCSSWSTPSEPHGITFLFKTLRLSLHSPLLALFFSTIFNADQVLSARSRFYCARTRDPKERKMGEGLPCNMLLRVLEKSKSLKVSTSNPNLSFPHPIRITSRWMFQSWRLSQKTSCTKEAMKWRRMQRGNNAETMHAETLILYWQGLLQWFEICAILAIEHMIWHCSS